MSMVTDTSQKKSTLISNALLDKTLAKFFSLEVIGIKRHDDDDKKAEEVLALQHLHEKSCV